MLDWVRNTLDRFNTPELREAARNGEFFGKELTDEALPIALFASRYFQQSSEVSIQLRTGNQPFDAIVDDSRARPSSIRFIESTVSDMDYQESLRMEILNRDRSVAAYGRVEVEGRRGNRTVLEAKSEAINVDDIRDEHLSAASAAVERKTGKKYPPGTALVVRIDDATPFRDEGLCILDNLALDSLVPKMIGGKFVALAFVGSQGAYLHYDLTTTE